MPERGSATPGHGDHWLAALEPDDPRLLDAVTPPLDAPDGIALLREPLSAALDRVQVVVRRRLVTSYPEPRATTLIEGRPLALHLWETRVEGWLTIEHERVGALTVFLTDLAERADRYAKNAPVMGVEVAGLAYMLQPAFASDRPLRIEPAAPRDARFLPDDHWLDGEVVSVVEAGEESVVDVRVQGGLVLPVTARHLPEVAPGQRVQGYCWLTGRWPAV